MAAEMGAVWAIDIGNNSLKALYLSTERGVVEVVGYDNIRHGKILSGDDVTDAEREELIAISLRKLVTKYDLSMEEIAIAVPSQNSFARFVNLPPVEAKRIPEMVQFEAVQQIPFGINEVQWDWQLMTEPGSSEIKVGIFAIKNDVVQTAMQPFNREDIDISYVQMAPMALYNYLLHDRPDLVTSDSQATVILNVGAGNTDLVVCTPSAVWQRCILIGGNTFTKAIADTFRLNFEKAEKLKRTAPVSKYARQIFQAMRPVFTDLASEVQRSLGFYNSSNPNTKIVKIIAMGGGMKLRGLLKYLQQTLQIPVERPDAFKRLALGAGVSQAKFHENVNDFGIVYGLALQGLGLAKIESNLLPRTIARSRAWASKGRYFIAAACILLTVSLLSFARTGWDRMNYDKNGPQRSRTNSIVNSNLNATNQLTTIDDQIAQKDTFIEKEFDVFKHREIVPQLYETIITALPNEKNTPEQASLYEAFARGDVEAIKKIDRKDRKQLFITNMDINFSYDLDKSQFGGADMWRRSRSTLGKDDENEMSEYDYEMSMMGRGGEFTPDQFGYGYGYGMPTAEEKTPGFVVTMVGYSPYGDIGLILDPPRVEDNPKLWGFITRLAHLDALAADGNSPFKLYKKSDPEQYKIEIKEIDDPQVELPSVAGIGVPEIRYRKNPTDPAQQDTGQWVLVDPLTKEVISKVPELNEKGQAIEYFSKPVYQVNDHWFTINLKFKWKDAPEAPKTPVQGTMMGMRPPITATPSSSSAKKKNVSDDF
jgi:type IV pilus assembly protein PilM